MPEEQLPPDYDPYYSVGYGGSTGYPVPQGMNLGKAELIDKIKPDNAVEEIRHRLLGEQKGADGEWKLVPALKNRKLSEVGAWEISNLMLGISSINISISKLKESEIKERLKRIAKTAMKMMATNWIEYDVKNVSQFEFVYQIVFSNTLAVLNQANDASIQELIKTTTFENRSVMSSPPKEKMGQKITRMLGLGGN